MESQRTRGEDEERRRRSHLFTVRLWSEALGDGQAEWRGKVQHVASGEARYFRDWATLVTFVLESLSGFDGGTVRWPTPWNVPGTGRCA